jgi:hypothetical protein
MPSGSNILRLSVHVMGARQCRAMVMIGEEARWLRM